MTDFDLVRGQFARAMGEGPRPDTIPASFADYYVRAFAKYRCFVQYGGIREIPPNDWPLICLLAEQERRLDELEKRLTAKEEAETELPRRNPGRPRKDELVPA